MEFKNIIKTYLARLQQTGITFFDSDVVVTGFHGIVVNAVDIVIVITDCLKLLTGFLKLILFRSFSSL